MTSGIKDELIEDIQQICKKFGIEIAINDYDKDELTAEQYDNLKFPVVFYNIYHKNVSQIDFENDKYRYDEGMEVILTMESREETELFNMLYLFLVNMDATNEYFGNRKYKRKIRDVFKLQETTSYFKGRRYLKKVLQFTYYAEHLINKNFN
jgi:hypothetical protein|nr:MAG TPA: hypothetical protein [Caudoviricetes sp.]